jgi:hypothetical protein
MHAVSRPAHRHGSGSGERPGEGSTEGCEGLLLLWLERPVGTDCDAGARAVAGAGSAGRERGWDEVHVDGCLQREIIHVHAGVEGHIGHHARCAEAAWCASSDGGREHGLWEAALHGRHVWCEIQPWWCLSLHGCGVERVFTPGRGEGGSKKW